MKQDIKQYVKGCTTCQANKVNTGPLKPAMIPITPEHMLPFQTVAMDFIMKLPQSGKYDTILTITDHDCSKAAIFIPCQVVGIAAFATSGNCNLIRSNSSGVRGVTRAFSLVMVGQTYFLVHSSCTSVSVMSLLLSSAVKMHLGVPR